jgi:O-antigen/teichoic acid export membrane protein
MVKTLKEKTISAIAWSFSDKFGEKLLFVITGIIIARMLSQTEYALVGILNIFTAIALIIIDSGFGVSLIREQNVPKTNFSTVFVFHIITSIVLYIILFFAAPLIAKFYGQASLVQLSRIIFLCLPISALGSVQSIVLTKNIEFKRLARINLCSILLSGIISIIMACMGCGVWTLVFQSLLIYVFRTSQLWIWGKWRFSILFDKQSFKRMFSFSINLVSANLIISTLNNIYTAIIGRFYSLSDTGNYAQATKYADVPGMMSSSIVSNTMLPIFSSISNDEERLKRAYRKTFRSLSFILFPINLGFACMAKPLIIITLTEKWAAIIPYFQLLCIAGIFMPLADINNNMLKVKGFSNVILRLESFRFFIIILALALTIKFGIIIMLCGLILARALCYAVSAIYAGRYTGYSLIRQCADMSPYIAISVLMAGILYIFTYLINNLYILLILQLFTALVFYALANKIVGSSIYGDIIDSIKNKFLYNK